MNCLDCHEDREATLTGGPHASSPAGSGRVSCLGCHDGDTRHAQEDPTAFPMSNPADLDAVAAAGVCGRCHGGVHQDNQQTLSPHAEAGVTCLDCHRVHGGEGSRQLRQAQPALCFGCHAAQRGDFALPYHHPAEEGVMDCSDCHLRTDDAFARLKSRGGNSACAGCHSEYQGPYPFEHQATVDYSTEEGGCVNCHLPHGSTLPRLLNQPYGGPHAQLCLQCHAVPGHIFNSHHEAEFAGVGCVECHVDIHGSYTSRYFFAPDLESQGCFAAGCHQQ